MLVLRGVVVAVGAMACFMGCTWGTLNYLEQAEGWQDRVRNNVLLSLCGLGLMWAVLQ